MSERWTRYYAAAGSDPRETLLGALARCDAEPGAVDRHAVDLGCGTGRDTIELLRRGWRVVAIDSQADAIERLRERAEVRAAADRVETLVAAFESVTLPPNDLVNASFSLPFCRPESFDRLWEQIVTSLRQSGRFCGQLFGERDEWASTPLVSSDDGSALEMTFHTRADVDGLLDSFEVEELTEVDEAGMTAVGDAKHWHLFHIVARKR